MSVYFNADRTKAFVTCAVCDGRGDDMALFIIDEEGELSLFPIRETWTLVQRIRQAMRFVWYGSHWTLGINVGWHEATDRDDVMALGHWLVEVADKIGEAR